MHVSVNELDSLIRKAAVGAGIEHGYAVETAQSALWLAAAGLDCIAALPEMLSAWDRGETSRVVLNQDGGDCRLEPVAGRPASAIYAAAALGDFTGLMLGGSWARVGIVDMECPLMALGQLGRTRGADALQIVCRDADGSERWMASLASRDDGKVQIEGDIDDDRTADLWVTRVDRARNSPRMPLNVDIDALYTRGFSLDTETRQALKRFFNRTLIPDSEESRRHGAGAGLVDSD